MLEIESFNALFADAANKKIKLSTFYQDDAGFFYCQWRRDAEYGPELKRRLPFNAALDAYLAVRDSADTVEQTPQDDLFE